MKQSSPRRAKQKPPNPEITMPCPICDKRALDISEYPCSPIEVKLKCPHCHNIVQIPLADAQVPLVAEPQTEYRIRSHR